MLAIEYCNRAKYCCYKIFFFKEIHRCVWRMTSEMKLLEFPCVHIRYEQVLLKLLQNHCLSKWLEVCVLNAHTRNLYQKLCASCRWLGLYLKSVEARGTQFCTSGFSPTSWACSCSCLWSPQTLSSALQQVSWGYHDVCVFVYSLRSLPREGLCISVLGMGPSS